MSGLQAIRLALLDVWEESFLLLAAGLIGGVAGLLLLPLPFVLAAHYGIAYGIAEERAVGWRDWLRCGRSHAGFFYKWALLVTLVSLVFLSNIYFYRQIQAPWANVASGVMFGLLVIWLLPQPLAPALYFHQEDRRLRVALRNAAVLAIGDPFSLLVVWAVVFVAAVLLGYVAWPLLFFLPMLMALLNTRLVYLRLKGLHSGSV